MALRDIVPFNRREGRSVPARRRAQDPFQRLHEEMDRMFEDFLPDIWRGRRAPEEGWSLSPDVDVKETDKDVRVTAELPGVTEKDIDVRIEEDYLVISGEKREEEEEKEGDYTWSECRYGSFSRTIPLGSNVDADKAEASFNDGVLKVTLPKLKTPEEETKRITVKSG